MKVYEALANAFVKEGVTTVFGLMGNGNMYWWHTLDQHPDVTIYEGAGINNGWADYRDRHLGPELKAFQNLQFAHSETKVTVLPGGQSAYATSRYTLKAKMGERDIDSEGLATYLLLKGANGAWQIRHSHTSSRARRPAA